MGELIDLTERRNARFRPPRTAVHAEFFFDLACPFTYLAAERVEREFPGVRWTPANAADLRAHLRSENARRVAEARAAALRLPLVWPEWFPAAAPAAMRLAGHAAECGRGAAFALAAGRLAFCGGFDLDDPEVLAEAAAAAGLALADAMRAARDARRDAAIEAAGRCLLAGGADRLPVLAVGRGVFCGEVRIAEAAAAARRYAAGA
jgi:2-hydroxychromene-2-carboxylate isomerase